MTVGLCWGIQVSPGAGEAALLQWDVSGSNPWGADAEASLQPPLPAQFTSRAKFVTGHPLCMPCHAITSRMLIVTSLILLWSNVIMHRAVVAPGKAMCKSCVGFHGAQGSTRTSQYHHSSQCWEFLRFSQCLYWVPLPMELLIFNFHLSAHTLAKSFQTQPPAFPMLLTSHTGQQLGDGSQRRTQRDEK